MLISVVINTLNRAESLRQTLRSLRLQNYGEFEVIVVNGPSSDDTANVLEEYRSDIRAVTCPVAKLGVSRNLGITLASGDLVAFLDDDAIPEPGWLEELLKGYDSERVAAVGGTVFDHTGYDLQQCPRACNRRCTPAFDVPTAPLWGYFIPQGERFAHAMGGASSFRRRCLVEIGGFDEEIEYFLDETDVCMRLVDHGYWLRNIPTAAVFHKFRPSHLRKEGRVILKPFVIAKNRFYVPLRSRRPGDDVDSIFQECTRFTDELLDGARYHHRNGRMTDEQLSSFETDLERGIWTGAARGMHSPFRPCSFPVADRGKFHRFPTTQALPRPLIICMITHELPTSSPGGIGTFYWDLARGLAELGHEAHIIANSTDQNRVDLEEGVWVHRVLPVPYPWITPETGPATARVLARAMAVHREVQRLGESRVIDIVSVPIWDSEGLFCLLDDNLTTVLTLQTTLKTIVDLLPGPTGAERAQIMDLERLTVHSAKHIQSNSHDMLAKLHADFGPLRPGATETVIPMGVYDRAHQFERKVNNHRIRILSVGRLEIRKGTDLFLQAALMLAPEFPQVDFILVGPDTGNDAGGPPYRKSFEEKFGKTPVARQVIFTGKVDQGELYQHYVDCDIFCLPSRYESFGLVFVEAMMFGKPVVGCSVGGMKEIVEHDGNGYVVPPNDVNALVHHLRLLIQDESLRARLGARSRQRFEELYSHRKMAENNIRAFLQLLPQASESVHTDAPAAIPFRRAA